MSASFSAVLLAGGKSSRMGRDKAFLEIDGIPLWQRQLRLLQKLRPREIFIAGPKRDEWKDEGALIVPDVQPDAGPLAGLIAAWRVSVTPLLLALAVDLPRMTESCLRNLLEACADEQGTVPMTDRLEPLAAVYPIAALALAEENLARGDYSLQKFVRRCLDAGWISAQSVRPEETELFLNLNTPADLLGAINPR